MASDCKHDFESNEETNYCAKGCGETWTLWTIKNLTEQVKMLEKLLKEANESYVDCNPDWQKSVRDYFKEKEGKNG